MTARREDGFHSLISLVARISLCDELALEWLPEGEDTLAISWEDRLGERTAADPGENLVLRAVRAFREASGFPGAIAARLHKRIPIGAGLGGGSTDAAGTLIGLQEMWGAPVDRDALSGIARRLGADVPFFLSPSPAIMRGIGDELQPMPDWRGPLEKWQVLVFRPFFGISTPWAYSRLAGNVQWADARAEETFYQEWAAGGFEMNRLPANDFRAVVDPRFPTVPVLLGDLNRIAGVHAEMTGSGSGCFALSRDRAALEEAQHQIERAWGAHAFCQLVHFG